MRTSVSVDTLLERVNELAPLIRKHATEAEQARRLSRAVVDAMLEAQLYSMARPKSFGGLELDPVSMFRVVEEVARHDGIAAWNLQLSVAFDSFIAWLPDDGAIDIMSDHPHLIMGGAFNPPMQATPVEGGYRLTGQAPFVSGSHDCMWYGFAAVIMNGDNPRLQDDGAPEQLFVFVPSQAATILDTWHTLGMRGTGSHDVAVSNVFIPSKHTAPMVPLEQPGSAYQGPLYRLTVWPPIALLAPPALGIARAAIDDLLELSRSKTPSYTSFSVGKRQVVQRQVAQAEAILDAGRAYLHNTFQDNWEAAVNSLEIKQEQKLTMQLATTYAIQSAAQAVDLVHAAAGTSAIRTESRFPQYFRDVHTITQHAFSSASRYESVGALMLGEESDWPFFAF